MYSMIYLFIHSFTQIFRFRCWKLHMLTLLLPPHRLQLPLAPVSYYIISWAIVLYTEADTLAWNRSANHYVRSTPYDLKNVKGKREQPCRVFPLISFYLVPHGRIYLFFFLNPSIMKQASRWINYTDKSNSLLHAKPSDLNGKICGTGLHILAWIELTAPLREQVEYTFMYNLQ